MSRKPPPVKTYVVASVLPSGFRIETCEVGMLTADIARLTRWPTCPPNVSWIFSPDDVDVTVTGGPPAVIGYACVALPVTELAIELAPTEAVTENVTAPRAVGVYVPV